MNQLRERVTDAVRNGKLDVLEQLAAGDPRVVRHLMRQMYDFDPTVRATAARGIALVARRHPRLRADILQRLIWGMDNDSGTNAPNLPEVVLAIAEEDPASLVPVVADLVRLAGDPALYDGLAAALELVVRHQPGAVGHGIGQVLNKRDRRDDRDRSRRTT
jgi:hypothetical protein